MEAKRFTVRLLLVVPLLIGALALRAPSPAAAAFTCTGVESGITIKGNLLVPDGAGCDVTNVAVRGDVTVGLGGVFFAQFSEIRGSVSGAQVDTVDIFGSVVRGGVAVAGAYLAEFEGSEVRGSVALSGATRFANLNGSTVRGGVTLDANTYAYVVGSAIGGDLRCSGNITNPYVAETTVGGARFGQCQLP